MYHVEKKREEEENIFLIKKFSLKTFACLWKPVAPF